jgi:hypothetical protein
MVYFAPSLTRKIIHQITWISFAPGVVTTDHARCVIRRDDHGDFIWSSSVHNDDHKSMNRKTNRFHSKYSFSSVGTIEEKISTDGSSSSAQ